MKNYEVKILKTGYCLSLGQGRTRADGTITLVKGPKNMIVDTGGPWDREHLTDALSKEGLRARDISHVICTHGHSDHTGNNNLFIDATFIVSHDISKGDLYTFHDFKSGASLIIDEHIEVMPTPGHTCQDVSVIVKTKDGVFAIVGDLFESEGDEELWKASSAFPAEQEKSRAKVLAAADFIIPGHGDRFIVKKR